MSYTYIDIFLLIRSFLLKKKLANIQKFRWVILNTNAKYTQNEYDPTDHQAINKYYKYFKKL